MTNRHIIILHQADTNIYEAWGSIKEISQKHDWSYHYLKRLKFPFKYKGWNFIKVKFRNLNHGKKY